jgi:hypothetical protein
MKMKNWGVKHGLWFSFVVAIQNGTQVQLQSEPIRFHQLYHCNSPRFRVERITKPFAG